MQRSVLLAAFLALCGTPAHAQDAAIEAPAPVYALDIEARVVPTERLVRVQLRLGARASAVEWIRFRIDPERHSEFSGDGTLSIQEDAVTWTPPRNGGALKYKFSIDHLRDERSYDARCSKRWAIFRGDDMVPPARVRTAPGARSRTRLHFKLPEGWSAAVPYARLASGAYSVQRASTRFDRPTGWMVLGHIGARRETIDGVKVTVAGPTGHALRRLDLLAFLRWHLPLARAVMGELPERLVVVGAGDPMWRGGLSGPSSLFIHADRPFITEDATSPLLHELVHTLMRARSGDGGDWVSEGLAELYSIELLRRSGAISRERYEKTRAAITKRGRKGGDLRAASVSGDTTAKAASVLWKLDDALRSASEERYGLADLARHLLAADEPFTTEGVRAAAEQLAGKDLGAFFERHLPAPPPDRGS